MQPSGPYNLALNVPAEVAPTGSVNSYTNVVLSNSSPFACKVVTENGTEEWLQAWSAQAYDIADVAAAITVTPALATSAAVTSGILTADWYQPADALPAGYPLSLTAQAVAATLAAGSAVTAVPPAAALLDSGSQAIGGGGGFTVGPYNLADVPAILLIVELSGLVPGTGTVQLNWGGAGGPYQTTFYKSNPAGGPGSTTAAVFASRSNTLTISFSGSSASTVTYKVIALPSADTSPADVPGLATPTFTDDLLNAQVNNVTIAASGSLTVQPALVYPTKATWFGRTGAAVAVDHDLEVWNGVAAAWQFVAIKETAAAGGNANAFVIPGVALPLSDWRLVINNTSATTAAAGTFAALTPERDNQA